MHTQLQNHILFSPWRQKVLQRWLIVVTLIGWTTFVVADPIYIDQGKLWANAHTRQEFYTQDQGSQLINFAWLKALKHTNGEPFLADQLVRYGYLPNTNLINDTLPVGFTRNGDYMGLTCAACHTRQIVVNGQDYRIDGGPALVDAQSLFVDLDKAVASVIASPSNFQAFANQVLPNPNAKATAKLKKEVSIWFERYDTIIQRGVPAQSWGPGRVDAVGMIFNRLTGLDIGKESNNRIIATNIHPADAPVRYPFLWNSPKQDMTQWPGFAKNGSDLLGLARNLAESYGVFVNFEPKPDKWKLLFGVNYLYRNSANFDGLKKLEQLVKKIGPPKYPWPTDANLAAQGKVLYQNNCAQCHGITNGASRLFGEPTWLTRIQDVGTDSREYAVMDWDVNTGILKGRSAFGAKLKPVDKAINVLSVVVAGSIVQEYLPILTLQETNSRGSNTPTLSAEIRDFTNSFSFFSAQTGNQIVKSFPYEARVLEGVWAAAPYLHNGSVPTLADLLEPASARPTSFKIGPNYDINKLGMAADQTKFGNQTFITSTDRNSGNANCGHEYGTQLSVDEKKALLEYLKTL